MRAITTAPTSTPESSAIRIAGATARAEEQAHHAGELDVAHAHAARVGERREQQEAAGGGARDQAFGLAGGVERGAEDEREHRAEQRSSGWG